LWTKFRRVDIHIGNTVKEIQLMPATILHHTARIATLVCALIAAALLSPADARAAETLVLTDAGSRYPLGTRCDLLEDRAGTLTVADVAGPSLASSFRPLDAAVPNFGYTRATYWFRFSLHNTADPRREWLLVLPYALIDDVRLYTPDGARGFTEHASGRLNPASKSGNFNRHFTLPLPPLARPTVCYVRVASKDSLPVPLEVREARQYRDHITRDHHVFGLYYGIIVVMVLFNLIIFIVTRDRNYLLYSGTLVSLHGLTQLGINGFSAHYFGDSIWWSRTSISFFVSVGAGMAGFFCISFLRLRELFRPLYYSILACSVLLMTSAVLSLVVDYYYSIQLSVILCMIGSPQFLLAGFVQIRRGYREARFYLLAWTMLVLCGCLYGLKVFALAPHTPLTEYAWQVGLAVETIILSLALGDRINLMRQEQMRAQNDLLQKEREARETQERFNESLEKLVEERTNELNSALDELKQKDLIIQRELDIAMDIQQNILPPMPLSYNGIRMVAFYRAMEKIGGDFYDIYPMKGGHLCVLMADSSGHGIPAAFVTAMAKITFSEATAQLQFPRDILRQVNEQMIRIIKTQEYLTAFLVIISPSYEVFFSNASHQKAFVARARTNELDTWDTNGLFVGAVIEANQMYEEKQDYLDFGDRLILYTDGLVEARNSHGEEYGQARLRELFIETFPLPLDAAKNAIHEHWRTFIGETPVRDDVTFLLVEIDPAYRELLEYKNRGLEHLYHNRVNDAIAELKQALKIDNRDAKVHHLLGKCFFKERAYDEAITHLSYYTGTNAEDADAFNMLAAAHYNSKRYEDALAAARQACALRPNFKNALSTCALALMKIGKAEESKAVWEQILAIDPANSIAKAELLIIQGQIDGGETPAG